MTKFFLPFIFVSLFSYAADIGMIQTARVEIPGERLEVVPLDEHAPLAVRLEAASETESGYIYDIDFVGLEPGVYDLIKYLQTPSGESPDVPPHMVSVERKLPPDFRGEIMTLTRRVRFPSAWYGITAVTLSVLWVLCLPPLIFLGRGKKIVEPEEQAVLPTLRDQLNALLAEIGEEESKEIWYRLEATLIQYLIDSRQISEEKAFEQLIALKKDDVAGPVIREFEQCLHAPDGRGRESLDRALAECARVLEANP